MTSVQNGSSSSTSNGQNIKDEIEIRPKEIARFGIYDFYILSILVFRILCLIGWILTIVFCTQKIYQSSEELIPWTSDPIMNPGPLTQRLNRGRDTNDFEWITFTSTLALKLIYWFPAYIGLVTIFKLIFPQAIRVLSLGFSYIFLADLMGNAATNYLFIQPLLYFLLLKFKSKLSIWIMTVSLLIISQYPSLSEKLTTDVVSEYYLTIISAWTYSRCISFCFDTWEKEGNSDLGSLFNMMTYVFYPPLIVTGPLVLYDEFESSLLAPQNHSSKRSLKDTSKKLVILLFKLARMAFWILAIEFLLHWVYFRPLSLSKAALSQVSLWTLGGIIYWLGQFFQMKYVVMYGISSAMAEYEGLSTPPLPICIAYVHRYSVLWRDFDRGLYNFLVRYIYHPTLEIVDSLSFLSDLNLEFKKLFASFITFVYVFIWHSTSYEILVWSFLNFIGITIEKAGSLLKKKKDSEAQLAGHEIHPLLWDFIVEPIVTIPLALMSILNSAVFCGNILTAKLITLRLWRDWNQCYILYFLYMITHVAVAVRTWPTFKLQCSESFKKFLSEIAHHFANLPNYFAQLENLKDDLLYKASYVFARIYYYIRQNPAAIRVRR